VGEPSPGGQIAESLPDFNVEPKLQTIVTL
jgi:hypothetical protein